MLYIILCIPLYVLNSFCDKYISGENSKHTNSIYNIVKFLIGTIILLPMFLTDEAKLEWIVITCGIAGGVMYAVSKMIILTGYEKTSVAFMTLCHASGILLPCIAGHFFWNEKLSIPACIGIILVIFSIWILKGDASKSGKTDMKGIIIGIVVLLASGGLMIVQKIMGMVLPRSGVDAYLFYTFATAFLILAIAAPKRRKITKKISFCALGSAVALYIISVVMTYLAADVPSVILFPLFNGSGIILVTLFSAVWFKEKITVRKACGMVIALIGLFLTNI